MSLVLSLIRDELRKNSLIYLVLVIKLKLKLGGNWGILVLVMVN